MWLFSFKKSPQEILEDKYLELIEINGIDKLHMNPPWFDHSDYIYYSGVIRWVQNVQILCSRRSSEEYSYNSHSYNYTYIYHVAIWKIESKSYFAEKIWKKMDGLYTEQKREIEEERARIQKETEEANALAKDKVFIEEYNRLCWNTWEFNKQFKLLDEIESLGKEQIKLLEKWEDNKNLIYTKREQFYSLTK